MTLVNSMVSLRTHTPGRGSTQPLLPQPAEQARRDGSQSPLPSKRSPTKPQETVYTLPPSALMMPPEPPITLLSSQPLPRPISSPVSFRHQRRPPSHRDQTCQPNQQHTPVSARLHSQPQATTQPPLQRLPHSQLLKENSSLTEPTEDGVPSPSVSSRVLKTCKNHLVSSDGPKISLLHISLRSKVSSRTGRRCVLPQQLSETECAQQQQLE